MMSGNPFFMKTIVASAAVIVFVTVLPVNADTIIQVDQQRSTSTLVIVPQCGGKSFADDAAEGFELFDSKIESELICDLAGSVASAHQQSQIDTNSMTASGQATSTVSAEVQGTIHAISTSSFEVTFELDSFRTFTLDGMIRADAFDDPAIFAGALLQLTGPGDVLVFLHMVDSSPDGENEELKLEEAGLLEPGQYTLRAMAASVIDNEVPPSRSADARFDFSFAVLNLGDLDGDGSVGTSDLLALLAQWGTDGAADFDGSGNVDTADLIILLANWGPCE